MTSSDATQVNLATFDTIRNKTQNEMPSREESLYRTFAFVLLAITFLTLIPNFLRPALNESRSVSPALVIHASLFLVWYILFFAQTALISKSKITIHKRLGYASLGLTSVLAISGLMMLLGVMRAPPTTDDIGSIFARTSYVWAIIHTLVCFTAFYLLAIKFRQRPPVHKRLMMLASLSMMPATITRVAYLPMMPIDGTALTVLSSYALLLTPIVIDLIVNRKVHPALAYGASFFVLSQIIATAVVPSTELGQTLAFPFSG